MSAIALITNLGFEYELSGSKTKTPLIRLESQWRYLLRLLPGQRHGEPIEEGPYGHLKSVTVWGVSDRTRAVIEEGGLGSHFPPVEAVRAVNDKRYSHLLENDLGLALPHAEIVADSKALTRAVSSCPHDWVLKHPLGVSGRERVLGRKGVIGDNHLRWADKQFLDGWELVFEPWVEKSQEFSLHFQIPKDRSVEFVGRSELITGPGGAFRGNAVSRRLETPRVFLETCSRAAEELRHRGYWGPVGFDCFSGRLGSTDVDRPLTEINARYSFGRMTLALANLIPDDLDFTWFHPRPGPVDTTLPNRRPIDEATGPGVYRLPEWAEPDMKSGSLILSGVAATDLDAVATFLKGD